MINNNNVKPTFGAETAKVDVTHTADITTTNTGNKRVESGAAWKRQMRKDNSEFLSIKLSFSKDRLKALLDKDGDTINLGFVAFPNPFKTEDSKRPDFRIYEELENK